MDCRADVWPRRHFRAFRTQACFGDRDVVGCSISLPPSVGNEAAQAPLHDISFNLHCGEILGIYGLLGAGRTELVETIAGSRIATKGSLRTGRLHEMPRSRSSTR